MELFTLFLFLVWTLKLMAIFNAVRWIGQHGKTYREKLKENPPQTKSDSYDLFAKCHGGFIPFGVKDFRLRQCAERTEGRKIWAYTALLFQRVFFRFNWLIAVTAIYLFIAAGLLNLDRVDILLTKEWHSYLLYLLAVIALGTNFLPFIEAVYSYAILESYAVSFHMQTSEVNLLSELRVFIWKVFATVIAGATAFYVAHIKYNALTGNIDLFDPNSLINPFKIYWQCFYLTVTTFATVGYGDIAPKYFKGQLIAFMVEAQSFFLIIIVFAALLAARSGQGTVRGEK